MSSREAYIEACTLLALPLADPVAWRDLPPGRWATQLQVSLDRAVGGLAVTDRMQTWPSSQAERDYGRAFLPPGRPLHPVESIFKRWTTQPGASVPMARETGWLGGDSAAHLRTLFATLEVEVPEEYRHAPDHLALELEFLGMLAEQQPEMAETFRSQHLDWLGDLAAAGQHQEVPCFYQDLFTLIAAFSAREVPRG